MIKAKAAVLHSPENIQIEEITLTHCEAGEVIVNLKKAVLCPTDIKKYYALKPDVEKPLKEIGSYILGHEAAGVVVEIGEGVDNVEVGDNVAIQPMISCNTCAYCKKGKVNMCLNLIGIGGSAGDFGDCVRLYHEKGIGGCFTTHLKAPATCVMKLPEGLSMEAGSMLEPLADVVHSVDAAGVGPEDDVVVIGLGPMGLLHIMVAKYNGAKTITGVDIDDSRIEVAQKLGATYTVNSEKEDVVDVVLGHTDGIGASKIFVTSGGKAQRPCTVQALQMVRKQGTVSLFASADVRTDELTISMNQIHYNMINFTGTVGFGNEHGEKALQLLASDDFDTELIRNLELPLSKIEEAISLYGKGVNLKVGLDLEA